MISSRCDFVSVSVDTPANVKRAESLRGWSTGAVALTVVLAGLILAPTANTFGPESGWWAYATVGLGALASAFVGLVLTVRLPSLPIGWLFLVGAVAGGISLIAASADAFAELAQSSSWVMVMVGVLIACTFPTGRPGNPAWRIVVGIMSANALATALRPLPMPDWLTEFGDLWVPLSTLVFGVAGVVRLVLRYRQGDTTVRQQTKWLILVLVTGGMLLFLSIFSLGKSLYLNDIAGLLIVGGSPIAVALAVLKYRLYEIDRLISRTLSYGLVVALLGAVFAGLTWLPGFLIGGAGDSGNTSAPPLVIAVSTLAVAGLFNPLRKRTQHAVDRRFNRSAYKADTISQGFAAKLQGSLTIEEIASIWTEVVAEALQPKAAGIWLSQTHPTPPRKN